MTEITKQQQEELNRIADAAAEQIVEIADLHTENVTSGITEAAISFFVWLDAQMDVNYFLPGEIDGVLRDVHAALEQRLVLEEWEGWEINRKKHGALKNERE